jgi:putative addiction module antidote
MEEKLDQKVIQVGNSLAITLPAELLKDLNLQKGDRVALNPGPHGYTLSVYDEKIQKEMAVIDAMMIKHRNLFRKLADS